MPVDQSAYRKWEGKARPTRAAVLAIASVLAGRYYKVKLVRWLANVVIGGACLFAPMALYFKHLSNRDAAMRMALQQFGFDRLNVLQLVNREFFQFATFFAVLLAAVVAAPLIAEDRRAKALPLYFSRPIRHIDYLLGKLLTGLCFVGALLLTPALFMYLAEIGFAEGEGVAAAQFPVLLRALLGGLLLATLLVSVALGVSACTDRPNYASLIFLGVMAFTWVAAMGLALGHAKESAWFALSPVAATLRIIYDLFPDAGALRRLALRINRLDLGLAWATWAAWTAAAQLLLFWKVRRVEVVS